MNRIASIQFVLYFIIIFFTSPLQAQEEGGLGNWLMYFGQNRIQEKFSIHSEVQYRNHNVLPEIEQLLLRTGVYYHFSNASFLLGYGFISSYDEIDEFSDPKSTEHRVFQELQLNQILGPFSFNHRYRIEQRWVNSNYKNRFRYRLMATLPLSKNETAKPFLTFYNEIFVATGSTVFDRNRLYGAIGYKFNTKTSMQLGVLNQQVNKDAKWYIQLAIFYNPDLRK